MYKYFYKKKNKENKHVSTPTRNNIYLSYTDTHNKHYYKLRLHVSVISHSFMWL